MKDRYRVFYNNPDLLQEMLRLRVAGWSLRLLSERYNVDHSSIRFQCKKFHILVITPQPAKPKSKVPRKKSPDEMTYKDHIDAYNARHPENRIHAPRHTRGFIELPTAPSSAYSNTYFEYESYNEYYE